MIVYIGLDDFINQDRWQEPTKEDYDQIDENLLTELVVCQLDVRPIDATTEFTQIRSTVRWYLAFDIDGWETKRRKYAQRRVAEKCDIPYSAVQDKVRSIYEDKSRREDAQTLFERDLDAIETAYESHLDVQ